MIFGSEIGISVLNRFNIISGLTHDRDVNIVNTAFIEPNWHEMLVILEILARFFFSLQPNAGAGGSKYSPLS